MSTSPSLAIAPKPRPISRRGWIALVAIAAVVGLLYALVVTYYNAEGGTTIVGGVGPSDESGILVNIQPVEMNASTNRATVDLAFASQGPGVVDERGRLLKSTRIVVASVDGNQEVKFAAGEPLGRIETVIGTDGEQAYYPFDQHAGSFLISADSYERGADGSLMSTGDIPIGFQAKGSVSGWDVVQEYPTAMMTNPVSTMQFNRAFSTRAFATVLLLLAVLLSAASLIVGILVFTNRRRAEVGLMSWAAALIFALPLLRNYMPNSPPVGVSLDIYVYLWVIVAAVIAAILDVISWGRQGEAVLAAQRQHLKEQMARSEHNAT